MPHTHQAAPETKAAADITARLEKQAKDIDTLVRQTKSADALRRLNETKQRGLAAVRQSGVEAERAERKGRSVDPVTVDRMRRQNADIDRANDADRDDTVRLTKEAHRELLKKANRPHGPSGAAPGVSTKSHDQAFFRKCLLSHLRTGQTAFGGKSLEEIERKAMSGQSNPDGGYLLQPEYDTGPMEKLLYQYVPMRQIATVRSISAASFKKAVSLRGRGAKWVGEVDARPATGTPTMAELEYPAMELYAEPLASQSLLEDSIIDLESWLAEEVIEDFAMTEAAAFITGDGNKKPMGLLAYGKVAWTAGFDSKANFGKTAYLATGVDGDFAALNTVTGVSPADKIVELAYTLKAGYRQNASYMLNRGTIGKVRVMKDGFGRFIWGEGDLSKGQPNTLNGYTATEAEQMPDIASGAFPIAFGDYKRTYIIVDRLGMNVLRDPYSAKPYVMFYTRKRVGGGIQNFEAMTLLKTSAS
ncbi:MAG: phage major capsid protein [Hyphomicrobiaceae bacterium]